VPNPPSKPQLAIYAAFAIAILLIGSRFLRESGEPATSAPSPAAELAPPTAGAPDGLGAAAAAGGGVEGGGARVVVDVKGAVRRPGVYRLPDGARTYDAVRRAGGLTRRADRVGVNLAARVVDGGEVIVPERTAGRRAPLAAAGGGAASADGGEDGAPLALDLNTASAEQLEQLDGIGPATAASIVAYREEHGGFASIDELDEVSGIGEARLASIRAQLGQ
jgi:competence protein ComEA